MTDGCDLKNIDFARPHETMKPESVLWHKILKNTRAGIKKKTTR